MNNSTFDYITVSFMFMAMLIAYLYAVIYALMIMAIGWTKRNYFIWKAGLGVSLYTLVVGGLCLWFTWMRTAMILSDESFLGYTFIPGQGYIPNSVPSWIGLVIVLSLLGIPSLYLSATVRFWKEKSEPYGNRISIVM